MREPYNSYLTCILATAASTKMNVLANSTSNNFVFHACLISYWKKVENIKGSFFSIWETRESRESYPKDQIKTCLCMHCDKTQEFAPWPQPSSSSLIRKSPFHLETSNVKTMFLTCTNEQRCIILPLFGLESDQIICYHNKSKKLTFGVHYYSQIMYLCGPVVNVCFNYLSSSLSPRLFETLKRYSIEICFQL